MLIYITIKTHCTILILLAGFWRNSCSSPRKDKYSKPPTEKCVVPHERIIRVNPKGEKQGVIPEKESPGIANPKGYLS